MNEKEKVLTHLDIPYSYELAKRMEPFMYFAASS